MFASQIETDTLQYKRYYISLEFNIFKSDCWNQDTMYNWKVWVRLTFHLNYFVFKEDTYKPISTIIILFKLKNTLKYMYQY